VTATVFTLRTHAAGPIVGAALVCPEARYCSVRLRGAERLDRRFATPRDWRALETELVSLPSGVLSSQSVLALVLTGRDLAVLDAKLMAWPLDLHAVSRS
jgi:hypothetical protein